MGDISFPCSLIGKKEYIIFKRAVDTHKFELIIVDPFTELPYNDYFEYFGPNYRLHIDPSTANNDNTLEYLKKIQEAVIVNLEKLTFAPSVQMQRMFIEYTRDTVAYCRHIIYILILAIPDDAIKCLNDSTLLQDMANPDSRLHRKLEKKTF